MSRCRKQLISYKDQAAGKQQLTDETIEAAKVEVQNADKQVEETPEAPIVAAPNLAP